MFSMSLNFFVILWRNIFFCILITRIPYFRTKTFFLRPVVCCRKGYKPPLSPCKLYVSVEIQALVLPCGWTGFTPPHIPILLVLCFVFCFLPFILFFFSVPQLSHLIWNFLNWSLAGSYLHVNALLWACFKLTSKLTRNWRVYILFKAEITSSQFSGSIGLSWKMSFCLLCCPWLNCIFYYGIQPW